MNWPTKGEIVEVEWVDSASTSGWRDHAEQLEGDGLATCRSAGYFVSKDRASVKLVQSQTSNGNSAELIAIPRSAVRSVKTLRRKG